MKLHMSKETKETLLGGIAGALTLNMESAANALVAGYPQIMKDRLNPSLPRNGELVADLAPLAVTWVVAKKKHSGRVQNVKTGVTLYDLPKLVDLLVYRMVYQSSLPASSARFGLGQMTPVNMAYSNATYRNASQPAPMFASFGGAGRYAMNSSVRAPTRSSGIGRYST